ncbi:MAG TPA: methyltransferase domain-containing protein [Terriglobia bacterium]|nr:methyltransferase domain-containing protein [Terriglobia bacterium]
MGFQDGGGDLPWTGERVVPGKTPALLVLEHIVRYRFAARLVEGGRVLDVACGTGYGSSILAEKAMSVVGIDYSFETIRYARKNYSSPNLNFSVGDCRSLPFQNESFGVAVMYEAIEHIAEQEQCLAEIRRILDPRGILILSTPNTARPTKVIEEDNPFHSKELTEREFTDLLGRHFPQVQLLNQHEFSASAIQITSGPIPAPAELVEDSANAACAKYFIAVCSAHPTQVPVTRTLGVGGIEHQIEIVKDLRKTQKGVDALLHQREEIEREFEAIRRDRDEAARQYAINLAAHQSEIEALRQDREAAAHQYAENLAAYEHDRRAKQDAIEALLRQRKENEKEYAKNLTAHAEVISNLERDLQASRLEAEWLYRWMPTNKLARKLFYGRELRKRLLHALGLKSQSRRSG